MFSGGLPTLSSDTLTTDAGWAVLYDAVPQDLSMVTHLSGSGDGYTAIGLAGGTITNPLWSAATLGLPLRTTADISVASGAAMRLGAGTTVLFGANLYVAGGLSATGTAAAPITLTSASATPAPGDWGGIAYQPGSTGALSYVHLSYAGKGTLANSTQSVGSCNTYINCYHTGLLVEGASPTISNSTIDQSAGNDVEVFSSGAPALHNNNFGAVPAGEFGVTNDGWVAGQPLVDATYNYWGSASGPSGAGPGTGVPVSVGVAFTPWLTAPAGVATLVVNPTTAVVFQTVTLTGTSFAPGETVKVYWDKVTSTALATVTATSLGVALGAFSVPQTISGTHYVVAVGQSSGRFAVAPVRVQPRLILSPTSGKVGAAVTVVGFGFGPTEGVTVSWDNPGANLGSRTTNSVGSFNGGTALTFAVPIGSPSGAHVVRGVGADQSRRGRGHVHGQLGRHWISRTRDSRAPEQPRPTMRSPGE